MSWDQVVPIIQASPGAVAVYLLILHRRVLRIERKLWPDVFGSD
ncbi:hypothetical protein [Alcanivorax sp.]|nr:hypothetical protein [Alcanivorax sp.]